MSGRYRKKPVVVEAVRWMGEDRKELIAFAADAVRWPDSWPSGIVQIATLEGTMFANPGDWIVKGVQGEFYPVKPDIFEETYEPA